MRQPAQHPPQAQTGWSEAPAVQIEGHCWTNLQPENKTNQVLHLDETWLILLLLFIIINFSTASICILPIVYFHLLGGPAHLLSIKLFIIIIIRVFFKPCNE